MANLQCLVSELKAGRYIETFVTRLLHFWEAHNVTNGGDLMAVYIALVDEKTPVSIIFSERPILLRFYKMVNSRIRQTREKLSSGLKHI
ncbi:unnamed protein product [Eruca vesicaria subsp. sativa]|uniref:Uncharacterized protein n=1 Tax=Eruca vesicaria subsp. sativa TaxID=29727 RepID=A0ABC8LPQ7_ERUVS|nr:unnamed protein product [Eruca vesicaria subsp. sativa]